MSNLIGLLKVMSFMHSPIIHHRTSGREVGLTSEILKSSGPSLH